jgi:putative tryptophan/tyrosine transport system substrate-binding protein
MKRREFIAGLAGAAIASPTIAQQGSVSTLGLLYLGARGDLIRGDLILPPLRKGLSEMGFVEGRNLAIEYRSAENDHDQLLALATELVQRRVTVIYATGNSPTVLAAKAATTVIPIVFTTGGDPVEDGLVASLSRPGGNVTGVTIMNVILTAKRLGLLHDLVPSASRFALLLNPGNRRAFETEKQDVEAAIATLGGQLKVFIAGTNDEIETAFTNLVQWRAEALLIGTSPLFGQGRGLRQLATLTVRHTLPAVAQERGFVEVGGLMSYGSSFRDIYRQAGIYVGRVLKGEKPAELPIMQPTKFELMINLTTAKAIGLDVPPTLLALADEVIE